MAEFIWTDWSAGFLPSQVGVIEGYKATIQVVGCTPETDHNNRHWQVEHNGIVIAQGYTLGSNNCDKLIALVLRCRGVDTGEIFIW